MSEITGLKANIILVGKMQAGKTTVADYLVENYGYTKLALADPIKQLVTFIDSMSNDQLLKKFINPYIQLRPEKKSIFKKILNATRNIPREFPKDRARLQFLGTDGVRSQISDTFWIRMTWNRVRYKNKIVIDDCRFLDEYEFFKKKGLWDLKIQVDEETQHARLVQLHRGSFDPKILSHISELEQDRVFELYPTNIIDNNGTKEELYTNVETVLGNYEQE